MSKKQKLLIWGREFDLDIVFNNYPGEDIVENENLVVENLSSIDFSDSLEPIKQYILKYYSDNLEDKDISNIFKYVIPRRILVIKDVSKRVFAVMCNFKFDMEHGLAILYENEQYKEVGAQDIVL